MKALVEKEIRLLLPAVAGALALAVLPVWLLPRDTWESNMWQTYLCLFGILMLAHSSIGREIGLKTLSFTLAQPLERSRIWWTKVVVLGASVGLVFDAWLVSGSFRAMLRPEMARPLEVLAITGLMAAAFTAGGLWTTVLLRQVAAAFWMTLLVPLAAGVTMSALGAADWMIGAALGLYAAVMFGSGSSCATVKEYWKDLLVRASRSLPCTLTCSPAANGRSGTKLPPSPCE